MQHHTNQTSTRTHLSSVDEVEEPAWRSYDEMCPLLHLSQLVTDWCASVDDHRAKHRAKRELASLVEDLCDKLPSGSHDDALWLLHLGELAARKAVIHHASEYGQQESSLQQASFIWIPCNKDCHLSIIENTQNYVKYKALFLQCGTPLSGVITGLGFTLHHLGSLFIRTLPTTLWIF